MATPTINLRGVIFRTFLLALFGWTMICGVIAYLFHNLVLNPGTVLPISSPLVVVGIDLLLWLFGFAGLSFSAYYSYGHLLLEQKNVESLRESEERFRHLVALSPEGIAVHQDAKLVFANRSALNLLRAENEGQLIGLPVINFVHPDSREMVTARIGEMARTGHPAPPMEEKFVRLDGSTIEVEVISAPLMYQGRPAFQVIFQDITYRKRLERAIQSIEKGVSAAVGQAFFESAVSELSRALESDMVFIGGYQPATDSVQTISVLRDGELSSNFQYPLKGAPCNNVVNQEICCYTSGVAKMFPDDKSLAQMGIEGYLGMPLWDSAHNPTGIIVCLYHQPIADPDFARGLVQIFASRVEAEMERNRVLNDLQQSQALLSTVINSIPYEVWVTDDRGACILQNPISRSYWGDTLGKLPQDLSQISPDTQKDWRAKNLRALAGEVVLESKIATINGKELFFESSMTPITVGGRVNGFVGVNVDITVRKRAEEKLKHSLERLSALREIDQIILGGSEIRPVMAGIARYAVSLLHVDAIEILMYDPATKTLEILIRQGVESYASFRHFPVTGDIAERAVTTQETIFENDFAEYLPHFPACQDLAAEDFQAYIAIPLVAKGSVRGVMEVFQHAPLHPDAQWWELAQTLTAQAAIAIDNMLLFQGLQRSNAEISLAYDLTLEGWSNALELRDRETEGHSQRVASLTISLAEALGVQRSQLVHIRRGALLHDIGKMGIPDEILHKPGPLNAEEWIIVKKHPQIAFDLLLPIPFLRQALDIPYCHHERWDGSGYPRGLKGHSIPLAARIFSIVDVWDALTSDRPYHKADTPEQVFKYLREQSGKLFDPEIVDIFEKIARR